MVMFEVHKLWQCSCDNKYVLLPELNPKHLAKMEVLEVIVIWWFCLKENMETISLELVNFFSWEL